MYRKFWFCICIQLNLSIYCSYKQELIVPGVTYTHIIKSGPLSIHVLEIDPKKVKIVLEHAIGFGCDREEVSSIAKRNNALAACNGSNYRRGGRYNGNSVNLVIIDNKIISDPQLCNAAIGWNNKGDVIIGPVALQWQITIGSNKISIDRINQPRGIREIILYTDKYRSSTLTSSGIELIIVDNTIKYVEVGGNAEIPNNGYVLSIDPTASIDTSNFIPGLPVDIKYSFLSLDSQIDSKQWKLMPYIIGGAGLLISHGQINTDFTADLKTGKPIIHCADEVAADFYDDQQREWLVTLQHPRTAIGIKEDGTWVFVFVDGRQSLSAGITLPDLAQFMRSLGCVHAINMGGGGCSTLYVQGNIKNSPSQGCERPVSEAFLILAQ